MNTVVAASKLAAVIREVDRLMMYLAANPTAPSSPVAVQVRPTLVVAGEPSDAARLATALGGVLSTGAMANVVTSILLISELLFPSTSVRPK